MLTKSELRQLLLEQRRCTDKQEKQQIDDAIASRVLHSDQFQKAKTIFLYVSTEEEISTRDIIAAGLQNGKCICVPKCLPGHRMEARRITSWEDLTEQTYGIPEPGDHCPAIAPDDIELCLVPALACDRQGYRLGYGGGFYDRFLPQTGGMTTALCAASRLLSALPVEPYDVSCSCIITENEVLYL
ncbi:MAG: 5-formyltetrahydrofolate cyclo-ligase [Butyricicoccus sp.]